VDDKAYNGTPFAFVVLHKGKLVAERYGKGITPETKLLSWSMGKSFTSAITGIMVGDSLVSLHAPMDIPQWQADERKNITLNNLLQMQSGLQWNEDYGNRSDVNLMLHREEDMGLFALNKPLEHAPGTHWYYSSGTTNIVMRYLRSRFDSDQAFLTYLRERLFGPLHIANPYFEHDMSGTPVGSSYLYVTARDFARFGQMYLDDGCANGQRILPEGWVEYTATPASASEGRYGAFFWLNRCKVCPDVP
jgi:CubicO group peptidase (beta-lactamase class C family)